MGGIADSIKTGQDKDGMLRRALERIIQLYTDKSHFVYELLQNAEDAQATSIKFVQYSDRLEVYHDGKPFTKENLQGLCDIGKSDKVDNLNQIGEFGVGFKSVFGICDTVELYSEPKHFREQSKIGDAVPFAVKILDFTRPEDIKECNLGYGYTTKFVFPYVVGKTFSGFSTIELLNRVLSKKLQNLGITTLLFMKNLESIEYQIKTDDTTAEGEYLLEKEKINDHCSLVSAIGTGVQENGEEEISYLKYTRPISGMAERTVDIAFPVTVDSNGNYEFHKSGNPYVSVYFPTETESKLDFIVQGPYRTTPNRSSIPADDSDNKRFALETTKLLHDSLIELRDSGKLNMSLFKILPISAKEFAHFTLFYPLHENVKSLFSSYPIIPCKNGGYVSAQQAKIARQEKLADLFSDDLLTSLVNKGQEYHWLPTFLTETNREYEQVYRFLNGELKIEVIRPEDLRMYFSSNPDFLPSQTNEWIIRLYSILENVGAAFSKSKNETNMLTAEIIKTSTGKFVAPFRKTESKAYVPNVFVPSKNIKSDDINFVDQYLYYNCRHFFDDILQIQRPNEYEFIIRDIKKRYEQGLEPDEEKHIADINTLLKYIRYDEYKDEITGIIKGSFVIRCKDGKMYSPYSVLVYMPYSGNGINNEAYYKNITNNVKFVDAEFYFLHDITAEDLAIFGVHESLLVGDAITSGIYDIWVRGRRPDWNTWGEFRYKLSMDSIKDVLKYISKHSTAKDAVLKSQAIFKTLLSHEGMLSGTVCISGSTPNLENESCELIKILRGEMLQGWDGKWLYTESLDLVSQKDVSKYDISSSIYGSIKKDSLVYELLGFKKTEADEVDDLKKNVSKKQLDAYFESELRQRYGISSVDLKEKFGGIGGNIGGNSEADTDYTFPSSKVKNWEALRKHAAEMLIYADPVKYDYAVRRIRVSNHFKETKAYLHNMYRYDGTYRYACQMCHEACSSVEQAQLFANPEAELDPMNLCLCPNCAAKYRAIRLNEDSMWDFKDQILSKSQSEISDDEQVIIPLEDEEIWFTQTHFAEIQALIKLSEDVKNINLTKTPDVSNDDISEKAGLSVYNSYIGKTISRKKDGFTGTITSIDDKYMYVDVTGGINVGKQIKLQLSFVIKDYSVYKIS